MALSATSSADITRYPSGKWHSYEIEETARARSPRLSEADAKASFLKENFPAIQSAEWKVVSRATDSTHTHTLYQLYLAGLPVDNLFTKLHYQNDGYISYATSHWEVPFERHLDRVHRSFDKRGSHQLVIRMVRERFPDFSGKVTSSKVWWLDLKNEEILPAYRYTVNWWKKGFSREWFISADNPRLLEERNLVRTVTVTNKSVYKKSPLGMAGAFDTDDITDLDAASVLSNSFVHVYREQNIASGGDNHSLFDVDPQNTYANTGEFSLDPRTAFYKGLTCTTCENQKFDAVNAYYHLNGFRQYISSLHSILGLTSSMNTLLNDPLSVIVNSLSTDFDGSGSGADDTDNAAYFSDTCRSGYTPEFPRCLAILRSSVITTDQCTGSTATIELFHLAREANVIVHEFQHYITDHVTHLVGGTVSAPRVGDALHEGYSDYFGASQVTRASGVDSSSIGAYAFQQCTPFIRNISALHPYENSSNDTDPHYSGMTWASGLWFLRQSLGVTYTDELAIKSQFYIPPLAGFVDAVEALVQADKALSGGSNVTTIRTLFYTTLKFNGGDTSFFRDPVNGIADVGFHSCGGVSPRKTSMQMSIIFFLVWLGGLLWLGRRFSRR